MRIGYAALAAVLTAWMGASGGCFSRNAASPERSMMEMAAERLPPEAWPPRLTDNLDQIIRDTPRLITGLELDGTVPESEIDPDILWASKRPVARISSRKYGVGIIRWIEGRFGRGPRFVSYSPLTDRPTDQRVPFPVERTRRFYEAYAKENGPPRGLKVTDERTLSLITEGTQIRLRTPGRGPDGEPARKPVGLIVHMAGLGSIEYEQPLLDELQRRGWAVLRVMTPSVWWFEGKPVRITSPEDIAPTGERLARVIDDLVAESAYATEAALEYYARWNPEVPQSPLVMVGCSAGALAAPAVVARMPEKFSAVVLIGPGANLLRLSQTSDLTNGGIKIEWPWPDDGGNGWERQRLYDAYLSASRLDPYHTARTMLDKPVLLIEAALDTTVPVAGADLLWERLERPERWTFSGGHRLLFWRLKHHAAAIAGWIEQAVREPIAGSAADGSSATAGRAR